MNHIFDRTALRRWLPTLLLGAALVVVGGAWMQGNEGGRPPRGPSDSPPPRDVQDRDDDGDQPPGPPPRRHEGRASRDARGEGPRRGPDARPAPPPRDRDGVDDRQGPPPREGQCDTGRPPRGQDDRPPAPRDGRDGDNPPPPPPPRHDPKRLEKSNPELFKALGEERTLGQKTHELARQYQEASASDREKLKTQVQEAVAKQFDARQKVRTLELKQMQDDLQHRREVLERHGKSRDESIKKQVSRLLDPDEDRDF